MKSITFRPLRRIKKTGKVVVASYSQWYRLSCLNYNKFELKVDQSYYGLPENESVYDSHGEQLFFFDYNPSDIPIFVHPYPIEGLFRDYPMHGYRFDPNPNGAINYNAPGLDCSGTPTFTHYTKDHIANGYKLDSMHKFEPLTVGMVKKWFGWFLYNLENATVTI